MTSDNQPGMFSQADLIQVLNRQSDAGNALVVAGLVEDWLEKLLLAKGRELTKDDVSRLFGRGAPLNSFSSKIEIAYMFELIDQAMRDDMRRIKDIRNAFAHTTRYVYFNSSHIADRCRNLSNWKEGADPQACYREKAVECVNAMKQGLDRLMWISALKEEPSVSIEEDGE